MGEKMAPAAGPAEYEDGEREPDDNDYLQRGDEGLHPPAEADTQTGKRRKEDDETDGKGGAAAA